MKVFEIQLKNPNHPTGSYRRDGEVFKIRRKAYAEEISKIIAEDKHLKISEVEAAKGMEIVKKLGNFPFVKPKQKKTNPEG